MEEEKPIVIVGCGPGSPDYLTPAARREVDGAHVLAGAGHLLELFPHHPGERIVVKADIQGVLGEIEGHFQRGRRIAVLVSGDPGLCSLAQPVLKRFGPESCKVIPGISSLQVAFARLGLDWRNARIIDAHGEDPEMDPAALAGAEKMAVFAGRVGAMKWIADFAQAMPGEYNVYICENLTLEGEQIRQVEANDLRHLAVSTRTIVLMVKKT